ncbi:MAG: alanine--tRNA ligase [Pseudomonadota bacterium]|nr:alanine--tRNA ligase [Pseudomonadota bacterium]
MTSSADLRESFLEFFRERGHTVVPSSALVPADDPTLLFTNAGMVQFKDVFLGREQRPYTRAASSQRCVRAGGKHNDLENVGYTARHHTFFEMLGNFSFGDYFKRDAIHFAWEYLTGVLKLPAERLWVTVFDQDDEAAEIWLRDIGVDPSRFSRIGEKDNFWAMGDTGPCGPCSEIFYDHGPEIPGGPPGTPDEDGDRYVEIWNLVFMQYSREADGTLNPLPKPSVDTGMGLERLAAVVQGVHSNYDIDLFRHLIDAAAEITGTEDGQNNSLKVIADHIRASAFLVVDGVLPSNEGRGYVLRRIIRRAARHGHKLGVDEPFFYRMVVPLVGQMGQAYPELVAQQALVERVLRQEEERFLQTLDQGMGHLEEAIAGLSGSVIPGQTVFRLYDTYGFPADLTADVARERGLDVDTAGFEQAMAEQRRMARAASHFEMGETIRLADVVDADVVRQFRFSGYERTEDEAKVVALFADGRAVGELATGSEGRIVLERTPFYAESGGQVGDSGWIATDRGRFEVIDTQKEGGVHIHIGIVREGRLAVGDAVRPEVDVIRRDAIRRNHSATHLLNAALRGVLGSHVAQKGSLVDAERLRFDFAHFEPVTPDELAQIEQRVNAEILNNREAETRSLPLQEAIAAGALSLAGEKYSDVVRVVRLGEFSTELCGGTHVARTGDIGLFKIISEAGVAAGVRRIEAVTGEAALSWVAANESTLTHLADLTKTSRDGLVHRVQQLVEQNRRLEKELEKLRGQLAAGGGGDLASQAVTVGHAQVLAARLDGADAKALRTAVDDLKNRLGTAAIVLASADEGKVVLVVGVTKDLCQTVPAGELANHVASQVGGRGGGRADMAQAGGSDPSNLDAALADVAAWVEARL